jgi:hypothetical protein
MARIDDKGYDKLYLMIKKRCQATEEAHCNDK